MGMRLGYTVIRSQEDDLEEVTEDGSLTLKCSRCTYVLLSCVHVRSNHSNQFLSSYHLQQTDFANQHGLPHM